MFTTSPNAIPSPSGGPSVDGDQRLAGVHADPQPQVEGLVGGTELGNRVADGDRGADRPLGVVVARHRRAEDRHHRVADELLDGAAEALEHGRSRATIGSARKARIVLGVEGLESP